MLVVEALVMVASVEKRVVTVPTVVEEVLKTDWPETVSAVADAVVSVVCPVTLSVCARVRPPVDEAEAKKSWPPIVAAPVVEAVERVARPDWLTEKREVPVEEAMLSKPKLEVEVALMLKIYKEEVALIPVNTPLSKKVEVARVLAPVKRARYPSAPPDTPAPPVIPREDVDTHRVDVPVDQRSCPRVPEALVES